MRVSSLALFTVLSTLPTTTGTLAQDANGVIAAASKTMGADSLSSITLSGTARNGQFGQSKSIGDPMGPVNVTRIAPYTRTITFQPISSDTALVSRATGPTQPPTVPGAPAPTPGVFNQNITGAQSRNNWGQALSIWTTPWGFLKSAAANNATVRRERGQQAVSFSPAGFKSPSGQPYRVTGYVNGRNLVTKVETHVEHAVAGDLLIEFEYSDYRNLNGVQVPTRIVQRQAGMPTFDATITEATPNPGTLAELLTPPAPQRGGGPGGPPPAVAGGTGQPPAGPRVDKLGDGAFKIGGNYTSLAIDMGDHVVVVEAGGNDARGSAVMAAARQAIPGKPVRYVVNSHPHFDHAGGLAATVAEGASILTHRNNEPILERLLSQSRTLIGDSLARVSRRRTNLVQGVGDRDVRKGTNGRVVELHRIPNEHSDGLLVVYLPSERALWSADITVVNPNPGQAALVRATVAALDRLKLDYEAWIPAHPPNPDRPLTRADVVAAARSGT